MSLDSYADCPVEGSPVQIEGSPVQTDAEATALLPPCSAAARTYHSARCAGQSPAEALDEVMALWRELRHDARPVVLRPSR